MIKIEGIKFYLKYVLYWLITIQDRDNYLIAKSKGYNCTGSRDDSYLIYGSTRIYEFDRSKPPTRNYLTFKEYKKLYHPKNKN